MTTSTTRRVPAGLAWRDPAVARRVEEALDAALHQADIDAFLAWQDTPACGAPIPEALPFAPGLVAVLRRASGQASADGETRVRPTHLGRALRGVASALDDGATTLDATAPVARLLDDAADRAFTEGAPEVRMAHLVAAVRAEVDARHEIARAA